MSSVQDDLKKSSLVSSLDPITKHLFFATIEYKDINGKKRGSVTTPKIEDATQHWDASFLWSIPTDLPTAKEGSIEISVKDQGTIKETTIGSHIMQFPNDLLLHEPHHKLAVLGRYSHNPVITHAYLEKKSLKRGLHWNLDSIFLKETSIPNLYVTTILPSIHFIVQLPEELLDKFVHEDDYQHVMMCYCQANLHHSTRIASLLLPLFTPFPYRSFIFRLL